MREISAAFALALITTLTMGTAGAAELQNVRVLEDDLGTRAEIELDGSAPYKLFTLQNPERLVVDFADTRAAAGYRGAAPNGVIASVRTGKPAAGALRIVFDLGQPVASSSQWQQDGQRARLVVRLQSLAAAALAKPAVVSMMAEPPSTPATEKVAAQSRPAPLPIASPSVSSLTSAPAKTLQDVVGQGQRELVVAIDAGHGGKDPGAHGPTGLNEKHVTLAVARELARQIDADPGMKAVLIRDGDTFVPLQQRYMKARTAQADLFISVHADASPNRSASGASVFVLSTRGASSQAARWLADKENAADLVGGVSLDQKDPHLAAVLLDLSQSATMRASDDIAEQVLAALKNVGKAHKHSVERANFVVLRSPDVPSMLIETGFITNPGEEQKLADPEYRRRLASAITDGVRQYFVSRPPVGSVFAARQERGDGIGQHVVSRGETLSLIAAQYGVAVNSLRQANHKRTDSVQVGERLLIPPPQVAAAPE